MKPEEVSQLSPKGGRLLAYLVGQVGNGRIQKRKPETFVGYSEALRGMGIPPRGRAGPQLRKEGLDELNDWTIANHDVPKITGLIVDKTHRRPGEGYPESHGRAGTNWEEWWLSEMDKAIDFDWSPYLPQGTATAEDSTRVREEEDELREYRALVTLEPAPAHIRQTKITVAEILHWLALGRSEKEILQQHPGLTRADIRASLAYAAKREEQASEAGRKISRLSRFAKSWKGEFTLPKSAPDDPRMDYLLERYWRHRR